jgi:hypothetical protein
VAIFGLKMRGENFKKPLEFGIIMKKSIVFGIFALVVLALALQSASAYAYYDYSPYYDKAYIYVGAHKPYYNYDRNWEERAQLWRAAIWTADSYDRRYNVASGKASTDVFYHDPYDYDNYYPNSNWRFKTAYDPRIHGQGSADNYYYYYKPRHNYQTGTFNWRY